LKFRGAAEHERDFALRGDRDLEPTAADRETSVLDTRHDSGATRVFLHKLVLALLLRGEENDVSTGPIAHRVYTRVVRIEHGVALPPHHGRHGAPHLRELLTRV